MKSGFKISEKKLKDQGSAWHVVCNEKIERIGGNLKKKWAGTVGSANAKYKFSFTNEFFAKN